jgi:hypothetical protein
LTAGRNIGLKGKRATITYFNDLSGIRKAWEDSEDGFESNGDHESVANLEAAWPESRMMQAE